MLIQITEEKIDEMSEAVEDMLHTGGKLMSCIERLRDESGEDDGQYGRRYGRREGSMSQRGRYGRREEDVDYDDEDRMMGNRRRSRDSMGRYM